MKMKAELERVHGIVHDTVVLLCRNGLTCAGQLRLQGLLGVTLDNDEVLLIHFNENLETNGPKRAWNNPLDDPLIVDDSHLNNDRPSLDGRQRLHTESISFGINDGALDASKVAFNRKRNRHSAKRRKVFRLTPVGSGPSPVDGGGLLGQEAIDVDSMTTGGANNTSLAGTGAKMAQNGTSQEKMQIVRSAVLGADDCGLKCQLAESVKMENLIELQSEQDITNCLRMDSDTSSNITIAHFQSCSNSDRRVDHKSSPMQVSNARDCDKIGKSSVRLKSSCDKVRSSVTDQVCNMNQGHLSEIADDSPLISARQGSRNCANIKVEPDWRKGFHWPKNEQGVFVAGSFEPNVDAGLSNGSLDGDLGWADIQGGGVEQLADVAGCGLFSNSAWQELTHGANYRVIANLVRQCAVCSVQFDRASECLSLPCVRGLKRTSAQKMKMFRARRLALRDVIVACAKCRTRVLELPWGGEFGGEEGVDRGGGWNGYTNEGGGGLSGDFNEGVGGRDRYLNGGGGGWSGDLNGEPGGCGEAAMSDQCESKIASD